MTGLAVLAVCWVALLVADSAARRKASRRLDPQVLAALRSRVSSPVGGRSAHTPAAVGFGAVSAPTAPGPSRTVGAAPDTAPPVL